MNKCNHAPKTFLSSENFKIEDENDNLISDDNPENLFSIKSLDEENEK